MLDIVPTCNPEQHQGKVMMQTWENGKKRNSWSNFDWVTPNLGPKIFFRGFYLY